MDALWNILPIVLEIATPVIILLAAYGIRALVKHFNVEQLIKTDELTDKIVGRIVDCIEKLDQVARKNGEAAINSGDKLAQAINLVKKELELLGLPKITSEIISTKIESYLFSKELEK